MSWSFRKAEVGPRSKENATSDALLKRQNLQPNLLLLTVTRCCQAKPIKMEDQSHTEESEQQRKTLEVHDHSLPNRVGRAVTSYKKDASAKPRMPFEKYHQ